MHEYPGWAYVPARDLAQYRDHAIVVYRSPIPTRIVDVSGPDANGMCSLIIEWTGPRSQAGGLIRHEAGHRETVLAESDEEYLVRLEQQHEGGVGVSTTNPAPIHRVGDIETLLLAAVRHGGAIPGVPPIPSPARCACGRSATSLWSDGSVRCDDCPAA